MVCSNRGVRLYFARTERYIPLPTLHRCMSGRYRKVNWWRSARNITLTFLIPVGEVIDFVRFLSFRLNKDGQTAPYWIIRIQFIKPEKNFPKVRSPNSRFALPLSTCLDVGVYMCVCVCVCEFVFVLLFLSLSCWSTGCSHRPFPTMSCTRLDDGDVSE